MRSTLDTTLDATNQWALPELGSPKGQTALRTVLYYLTSGQKIMAIKAMRHFTGMGLKESKDFCDLLGTEVNSDAPFRIDALTNQVNNLTVSLETKTRELASVNTRLRQEEMDRRRLIEADWQLKLRHEAELRKLRDKIAVLTPAVSNAEKRRQEALKGSIPGRPISEAYPNLITVDQLRQSFVEHISHVWGKFDTLGKNVNDVLHRLDEIIEANGKKAYTPTEWRDLLTVHLGQLSGICSTFNSMGNSLDSLQKAITGRAVATSQNPRGGNAGGLGELLAALLGSGMVEARDLAKVVADPSKIPTPRDLTGTKVNSYDRTEFPDGTRFPFKKS